MGKLFLIVIDAYSKWIDVFCVSSTSAVCTISKLRTLFATHGLPEQIVSDNGTGFRSAEFQQFTAQNGIKHIFTSPYHPASNGLAERAVQIFKSTISKMDGPIELILLNYRITPQTTTELSPSQLLMGRKIRTCLDLLHPDTTREIIQKKQQKTTSDKQPREFKAEDHLFAKDFHNPKNKWIPVKVVKKTGPVSYEVITDNEIILRRHVDHLRKRFSNNTDHAESTDDNWQLPDAFTGDESQDNQTATSEDQPPENPPSPRRSTRVRRPVDRYAPLIQT